LISTSSNYKSAVVSPIRETKAILNFEILDVDANTDATDTVTSEVEFSKKDQLFNQVRNMSGKYATLEDDYLLLDGSFSLPPKAAEVGYEVGWWSSAICGLDGTFSPAQVLTCNFTKDHSSIGLTITFDAMADEYASEFTITVYNSGAGVIYTASITGNTLTKYILEQNLSNFRQVVITVTKWATPYRRARITEVDFGIIKEYEDTEIINMSILEEIDTLSNQVTANELKFTLDNQDKSFNILNPAGVYPYLQRKQKLKAYLGVVLGGSAVEYIPMGVYYLAEWNSDEGALTASFTARDMLDILTQGTFTATTYTSKTLTYILQDIFTRAGVTDYSIDSALSSITVTGTLKEANYRDTIQTVALAGMSVVYCNRSGTLYVKQLPAAASTTDIVFDNVYHEPQIKLNKLINTVQVVYGASLYTLVDPSKPSDEQTQSVKIDNPLISTLAHATSVGAWVLAELKKRFIYEINWRQDPSFEAGDVLAVEDSYGANADVRITKQEFTYQGYLSGKTTGRSVS